MPLLVVAVSRSGLPAVLVDVDAPVATADDLGLTRGDGCFEGLRLVRGAAGGGGEDGGHDVVVPNLGAHLARMQRSARALDLPDDPAPWAALLDLAAGAWARLRPAASGAAGEEAAVKLSMTRGRPAVSGSPAEPTVVVTVTAVDAAALAARRDGVRVATMSRGYGPDAFTGAPWLLGGVKTLSYAVNTAAQREAVRRGADDALLLAADGSLLEAPTAAVLWVPEPRTLLTVEPGTNGILGSTTQQLLFARAASAGWRTAETTGTPADLRAARAVLLTSAVRGPVAVRELDGEALAVDAAVVAELQDLAGF